MTEALALKSSPASNSYCGSEGSKEHPAKRNVVAKFLGIYRSLYIVLQQPCISLSAISIAVLGS